MIYRFYVTLDREIHLLYLLHNLTDISHIQDDRRFFLIYEHNIVSKLKMYSPDYFCFFEQAALKWSLPTKHMLF